MDSKIRQRVLSEWRGYWEPRPKPDRQKLVGEVLPGLMEKLGLGERFSEQEMIAAWREVVGEFLAGQSNPIRLRRGILEIQVGNPNVRYELDRNMRSIILPRLKERFGRGVVQEVRYVLG